MRGRFVLGAGFLLFGSSLLLQAATCAVGGPHAVGEAEKALFAADYAKAEKLFRAGLGIQPGNVELTAWLVQTLLKEQKVKEASDTLTAALKVTPASAALISLRGETELREGLPWQAAASVNDALQRDPCLPRGYLLLSRLESLSSMHASSRKAVTMAHKLDPTDPEIRRQWLFTLPLKERLKEAEAYGSSANGNDADEAREWGQYLDWLKKRVGEPHKPCRLTSQQKSTQIPFEYIRVGFHSEGWGLPVKLNNKSSLLQVDTGATGLLVSRKVAERAGLKAYSAEAVSGIGDRGEKAAYTAYVDKIRIGDLEFEDCQVTVMESKYVAEDLDGLIGMDVFSRFLVTLDFPGKKLLLSPLPKRPEAASATPSLNTDDEDSEESEDGGGSQSGETKGAASHGDGSQTAANTAAQARPRGPFDRYFAPEMKDYVPIYRAGHNLLVPTALNGGHVKLFILDTGAWATSISPDSAREVTNVQKDYDSRVVGLSGQVTDVFKADEVTFTFARLSQKVTGVPSIDTAKISKAIGVEVSGFLGAKTLDLLTIHIDYRDGLIKCEYDPKRLWR